MRTAYLRTRTSSVGRKSQILRVFRPLALWALCLGAAPASAELVHFKTSDGIRIEAEYRAPRSSQPVVVLLHGLGAGRSEWWMFVSSLAARGYGTLAVDARGHGGSGGPSFKTFRTPRAWLKIEEDLMAALSYLERRGTAQERVIFIGASIGANIALYAARRAKGVPLVVLLSPGYDYQGVRLAPPLKSFDRPVIAAAAPDDRYSYKTVEWLRPLLRNRRSRVLRAKTGHGAEMFWAGGNEAFGRELLKAIKELGPGRIKGLNRKKD
ncbi:MAG: alpha/beta fold hydrolase [Elusimicrobiota bacterium]